MNKVMLVGRLTAKPELRYTGSNTAFLRFTVAVNRPFANAEGKREADFINVVAWRKQAETIAKFFDKGNLIGIEGRLQTGSYDDQNGNKRYTTDVQLDNFEFVERFENAHFNYIIGFCKMENNLVLSFSGDWRIIIWSIK